MQRSDYRNGPPVFSVPESGAHVLRESQRSAHPCISTAFVKISLRSDFTLRWTLQSHNSMSILRIPLHGLLGLDPLCSTRREFHLKAKRWRSAYNADQTDERKLRKTKQMCDSLKGLDANSKS